MTDIKDVIAYHDNGSPMIWRTGKNSVAFDADVHDLAAQILYMKEEIEEQAATIAKLPRYANGEAFVPGVDECHVMIGGEVCYGYPTYNRSRRQWSYYNPGFKGTATRAYPTAAECGEGEGR